MSSRPGGRTFLRHIFDIIDKLSDNSHEVRLTADHHHDIQDASMVSLVVHGTTDHYHLSSNVGVGIYEEGFIFDFASLPLEVARPI